MNLRVSVSSMLYVNLLAATLVLTSLTATEANGFDNHPQTIQNLSNMPLTFTENVGQWDSNVLFRANAGGATMWFATDGAYYQFTRRVVLDDDTGERMLSSTPGMIGHKTDSIETIVIKANFVGSNAMPNIIGIGEIEYKCNYFIGNDATKWHRKVRNFSAVLYEDIYDGIDLKYYGNGKQMEYDFLVSPGTDYSKITIRYEGAESISINEHGELVVKTKWGDVVEQHPVVYQIENNKHVAIAGRYNLKGTNDFGFELAEYNKSLPLVIDPILSYSTYLGGDDNDMAYAIAVDSSGNAYVTGATESTNFPIVNPYQTTYGGAFGDVFVTKLSSSGNALIYSTYIGGSGSSDGGYGIAVDSLGQVYLTGGTGSSDFPVVNAFQATHGGGFNDVFVAKLSGGGDTLLYSTFIGGSLNEYGNGFALDDNGCTYITGRTNSTNFPTQTAFQNSLGGNYDAYLTKLGSSGSTLLYSTYLGGSDWDEGLALTIDSKKNAYVTGTTASTNFSVQNAYQPLVAGGRDAYLSIFDSLGTSLTYSSYFGGAADDEGYAITLDDSGKVYISGKTSSTNFPVLNAYQTAYGGGGDVFVTKFSSLGDTLIYSTYLGGTLDDYSNGIAVDSGGNAFVTGSARSTNFPIKNATQPSNGGAYDAFLTTLNSFGNDILSSTFIGGYDWDHGYGIAFDNNYNAYIAGYTWSSNFPVLNGYQATFGSMIDAFVAKFSDFLTDIEEFDTDLLPIYFNMSQNYPNPFNPTTTIEFTLPAKTHVSIIIYNLLGQRVKQLVNQEHSAGNYRVNWDGTNSSGARASTGLYFYRLETESFVETKKMLLIK